MALTPREPFEELYQAPDEGHTSLRDAVNRLFASSLLSPRWLEVYGRIVPVDVRETDGEFVIEASLPGFKQSEMRITATENAITIRASHQAEEEAKRGGAYVRRERYEGQLNRAIGLPTPIDPSKVTATYEQGVLTLRAPKAAATIARQIEITINPPAAAH